MSLIIDLCLAVYQLYDKTRTKLTLFYEFG